MDACPRRKEQLQPLPATSSLAATWQVKMRTLMRQGKQTVVDGAVQTWREAGTRTRGALRAIPRASAEVIDI